MLDLFTGRLPDVEATTCRGAFLFLVLGFTNSTLMEVQMGKKDAVFSPLKTRTKTFFDDGHLGLATSSWNRDIVEGRSTPD